MSLLNSALLDISDVGASDWVCFLKRFAFVSCPVTFVSYSYHTTTERRQNQAISFGYCDVVVIYWSPELKRPPLMKCIEEGRRYHITIDTTLLCQNLDRGVLEYENYRKETNQES